MYLIERLKKFILDILQPTSADIYTLTADEEQMIDDLVESQLTASDDD